jgi:hypothetical protein
LSDSNKPTTLFAPSLNGAQPSMLSAPDPIAVSPGQFTLLQNVRVDNAAIEARNPTTLLAPAPFVGAVPRGLWAGRLDGLDWMLGAWSDGADVRLYDSADGGATWTEVTVDGGTIISYNGYTTNAGDPYTTNGGDPYIAAGSLVTTGPYANTRFPTESAFVAMAQARSPDIGDVVICQNGVDSPRIYSRTLRYGVKVAVIEPVDYPSDASNALVKLLPKGFFDFTPANWTVSNTTGTFAAANAYRTGGGFVVSNNASSVGYTAGSSFVLNFTVPANLTDATQLCLLSTNFADNLVPNAFKGYKIEAWNGSAWTTLYDPGSPPTAGSSTELTMAPVGGAANFPVGLFTFDIASVPNAVKGAVSKLRFTLASATSYVLNEAILLAVYGGVATGTGVDYGSGSATGVGSSYLVSLYASGSGTESAGVVVRSGFTTPLFTDVGAAGYPGRLPDFKKVVYTVSVPIVPPTPASSSPWASTR